MRKRMRKILPLLLVFIMVFGISTTAHAATYPTAKRINAGTTLNVKRGKTVKFTFRLDSGSYTKNGSNWRAGLDVFVKSPNGGTPAGKEIVFTGRLDYTLKWKVPKNLSKGRYTVHYRTYYKVNGKWYYNSRTTRKKFYINVY